MKQADSIDVPGVWGYKALKNGAAASIKSACVVPTSPSAPYKQGIESTNLSFTIGI